MVLSRASKQKMKKYASVARKSGNIPGLSAARYYVLKKSFYEYCRKHGFYQTRRESIENNGKYIFQWQDEIADKILRSLFQKIKMDLSISILRQVGKTEMVGLCTAFCLEKYFKYFKEPLQVAIIAPEKDTAVVPFERINKFLDKNLLIDGGDTKKYKKTIRGDEIKLYGIYDEYKGSTIEGNTFHMIIRDEAHKGSDRKFIDEVLKTTISKLGVTIRIGNGGFRDCDYYQSIKRGNSKFTDKYGIKRENALVKYTYAEAKPYFEKLHAEGLEAAQVRLSNIDDEIKKYGLESIETRKNYFCEWILEFGNVVTMEQLEKCHTYEPLWNEKKPDKLYLGLDFATWHDRTIATIMNERKEVVDWIIVKDNNERVEAREQCERMRDICDERGYTEHLIGIGFDATGVGSGGINEFLEDEFLCELIPYDFKIKSKHEWYSAAIESIATGYEEDRVKFSPVHPCAEQFQREWVELEQTEMETQKYKKFGAPRKRGCYDDFVASFAIVNDLIAQARGNYQGLTPIKNRYKKRKPYKPEKNEFLKQYTTLKV